MKKYLFLDGSEITVADNTCRGCYLNKEKSLPVELQPIIQNDKFCIRQDAECPIPGFYIVSAREHIHSIGDLNTEYASEVGVVISKVRHKMMKYLEIDRAHMYLEERIVEPHFHVWLLPLWKDYLESYHIDPKVWQCNIKQYLDLFNYEQNRKKILRCNEIMSTVLRDDDELIQRGYR